MNEKVIVTGGAGFIGSHLVDLLIRKKFNVLVLDDLSGGNSANINNKALFKKIDICWQNKLTQKFLDFRPKFVFHLAGKLSGNCRRVNVLGTQNVVHACLSSGVKKLIFTSSVAVYGDSGSGPKSKYGKSKLDAEEIVKKCPSYSILRLANVYGPGQKKGKSGGVIPIFCSKMNRHQPLPIYGDGQQTRDFIYVSDVVGAIYNTIKFESNNVLNISTGKSINLLNLIKIIEKAVGQKAKLQYLPARKGDIMLSSVDSRRAQKVLNWKAKVDICSGIKKII